jgi:mRNA interferase MazF
MTAPACLRGEIWLLDWNPRRGSEQSGFRPGIIVQSDLGNRVPGVRTTIVVTLTTQGRAYLFYVPVPKGPLTGLKEDSWANCTQVLTIDRERLVQRLGSVEPRTLRHINQALMDTLELGWVNP